MLLNCTVLYREVFLISSLPSVSMPEIMRVRVVSEDLFDVLYSQNV